MVSSVKSGRFYTKYVNLVKTHFGRESAFKILNLQTPILTYMNPLIFYDNF